MDKSYVEQYGSLEQTHWWFIIRRQILLQSLQKFGPARSPVNLQILNVGAAAGGSTEWLSKLGNVVSVENDPLFLAYLAAQNIHVINASITELPMPDNAFDLVCAFDVIEHVANDQQAAGELWRVCKPGGQICITVPAIPSLWSTHDIVNGHQRRYTKSELITLFSPLNTHLLHCTYFNSLLFVPVWLFRKFQWVFRKKNQPLESDFGYFATTPLVNRLLKFVFGIERKLLQHITFPVGISLLMVLQKAKSADSVPKKEQ